MMQFDPKHQKNYRRLVIFWEGTSNTLQPLTTQIGLFSECCQATEIHPGKSVDGRIATKDNLKLSFDGCAVTNGAGGALLAWGLNAQVDQAIQIVSQMTKHAERNKTVPGIHVVAVGLSRGGMACMKFAQKLASTFKDSSSDASSTPDVTLSTLLFDPVPGNAVSTGFPWTAYMCQDLSRCHNLRRVLALYPYQPLPDVAMHAPTLCRYNPQTTLVQEDVTLGCHQGSLYMPTHTPRNEFEQASNLSIRRITDFLKCEGLTCEFPAGLHVPSAFECCQLMRRVVKSSRKATKGAPDLASTRKTHDQTGQRRNIVRYHQRKNDAGVSFQWLNKHHEQLANALETEKVSIESPLSLSASLKAVYGKVMEDADDDDAPTGRYLLNVDGGHVMCPSRFR